VTSAGEPMAAAQAAQGRGISAPGDRKRTASPPGVAGGGP
jgi:hypothetical protein